MSDVKLVNYKECIVEEHTYKNYSHNEKWKIYKALCEEYLRLINENRALHGANNEMKTLYTTLDISYIKNDELQKIILKQNTKITELIEENKTLREKIDGQNIKITELFEDNKTLREKIDDQNIKINNLENYIIKKLYNKYIIAIQDVNFLDQLESKIPQLVNIRSKRIADCHYIDFKSSIEEKDKRRSILLDKLKNIPSDIEQIFEKKYPTLLPEIIKYVAPNPVVVSEKDEEDINEWWEDL